MVREGWLKHGPGNGKGRGARAVRSGAVDKALDLVAGEIERGPPPVRQRRHHGRLAGLVVRRPVS
jgi:hypothetical protein